jgi:uncharacterized protein with von Willebrand factor type A (vWA) domain
VELIEDGDLRTDILMLTDANFGPPPDEFMGQLAEVKQRHPLHVVSVVIGDDSALPRMHETFTCATLPLLDPAD